MTEITGTLSWRFVVIATVTGGLVWLAGIAMVGLSQGFGLSEEAGLLGTSALIAIFHWALVQRVAPASRWWIDAYWAGWYVAWLWSIDLGMFVPDVRVLGGVGGGVGGIVQWIAFRRRSRRAWLSIVVSPIALVVACQVAVATGYALDGHGFEEAAIPVGSAIAGMMMGLLMALQLMWISHKRRASVRSGHLVRS